MSSSWPTCKLAALGEQLGGGTPSRKERRYWGSGTPWFTVADLTDNLDVQRLTTSREEITDVGMANSAAHRVPPGSLVVSTRVVVGKVGIAEREMATNQDFVSFILDMGKVDAAFVGWFILSAREAIRGHQNGATIQGIRREILNDLNVPVPPLAEQRRIVARIRNVMERVDEVRRLRSENESTAGAVLAASLREEFEGLKAKHSTAALGRVTLESRYGTSEKCDASFTGTPVLRIPNVAGGQCNVEDLKYLARRVDGEDNLILRAGDLLVVRTNGSPDLVGRCAVVPELSGAFGYASYLIRFRLDEKKVRPKFLSYFLSSTFGRDQIAKLRRTSAGQYNINSESLRSILIPLPPVDGQDTMIERMDRIDSSVRDLQARQAIETVKDALLPAAILRKAFAGKL